MTLTPVPPMMAAIGPALPVGELWSYEIKWDGYRALLMDMKSLRWVKPHVVIEVAFTEFTAGVNLRHASFVGVRDDKEPRAVHRRA